MRRLSILAACLLVLAVAPFVVLLAPPATAIVAADGICYRVYTRDGVEYSREAVADTFCVAATAPPPTNTPVPPTPTATAAPGHDDAHWHGPAFGHEHGDAPPAWVSASRWMPMFAHPGNTPNENVLKHTSFKGYLMRDDGVDVYVIMHLDTNPSGHSSRFHSVQIWARDAQGGVSHWDYWLDFGTGASEGPQVRAIGCESTGVRPIMAVNYTSCGVVQFESWYSNPGQPGPGFDFGFNTKPQYYGGVSRQNPSSPDIANAATWIPTGQLNDVRRIEAAWYGSAQRGTFYMTQFGTPVSGPTDAQCGTTVQTGAKSYTVLCLEQYIAPTMTPVVFPNNSVQKTYPMTGVRLPN